MNVIRTFVTIFVCLIYFNCAWCFNPMNFMDVCHFTECCTDDYIRSDLTYDNLQRQAIHNQDLAVKAVANALHDHIGNAEPEKALAISFHGSTGTGKNLLANLIVKALYENGVKSKYVHYYNGHLEYYSQEKITEYERQIQEDITNHLWWCPRSIFIFDKVDHMPRGMLNALIPFLDYNPRILKVNPTRAIFIFISNIGATSIEKKLIAMWEAGTKRETAELQDFKPLLVESAFFGDGGFHKSDIIKSDLIAQYLPFLPFETIHLRKCIDTAFKKRDIKVRKNPKLDEMIDEAMKQVTFGPAPYNLFSESGCKLVDAKVAVIVERSGFTNQFISTPHYDDL